MNKSLRAEMNNKGNVLIYEKGTDRRGSESLSLSHTEDVPFYKPTLSDNPAIDGSSLTIYDAERGEITYEQARRIIEETFGEEYFREYTPEMFGLNQRYDRQYERGKSRSDAYHAERQQNRTRIHFETGDDGEIIETRSLDLEKLGFSQTDFTETRFSRIGSGNENADIRYSRRDRYEAKDRYVSNLMSNNARVESLSEEQHSALESLARIRHEFHSHIESYWDNNGDWDIFDRINEELTEAGLPAITFSEDYVEIPTAEDWYSILDDDERAEYNDDITEWMENSGVYEDFYHSMENLNKDIEKYLSAIDKEHGTQYAPTGYARLRYSRKGALQIDFDTAVQLQEMNKSLRAEIDSLKDEFKRKPIDVKDFSDRITRTVRGWQGTVAPQEIIDSLLPAARKFLQNPNRANEAKLETEILNAANRIVTLNLIRRWRMEILYYSPAGKQSGKRHIKPFLILARGQAKMHVTEKPITVIREM